jgi:hypothetical protein
MLRLNRLWSLGGASISQKELRFGEGVVCLQEHEGLVFCETGRSGVKGWSKASIVLQGQAFVGSRRVSPGEVVLAPRWGQLPFSGASPDLRLLLLAWRADDTREGAIWRLGPLARARVEDMAADLLRASPQDVLELGLLLLGRSELPRERLAAGLHAPDDARLAQLAQRICQLSSCLNLTPTGVDLAGALGGNERRMSELAVRYFRRYHATVSGWRDYLFWLRIELGISALKSGVRPVEVSPWLGFRSLSALDHAFRRAGLAPPGAWLGSRRPGEEP